MPIKTLRASLLALGLGLALAAGAAMAQTQARPAADLPGGASALRKVHGDWTVACQMVTGDKSAAKKCVLSQEQVNPRKQRTLAINLVPKGDGSQGAIVLPFGVAVTKGVTLAVDGIALGAPRPFSTCLQLGCIVPLILDAKELAGLVEGKLLTVTVRTLSDRKLTLPVSLKGLKGGLARTRDLLN
ncbi:invasion associated locus B family protein [Acidimangrovimonas pyrenivorans]|uniref:Invasion associated locus B family protein n=1 Tax=Acidimangrovimonas pyrenivorans TaxID=2030798 RepID=A0ABV7AKH3_9RHOB